MTIVYVDLEHESALREPTRADSNARKLEAARSRIASIAGEPAIVLHYAQVSPEHVAEIAPSAIVISGSTTDWAAYDPRSLAGLLDVIRLAPTPTLGICAGHQLIGHAHGAAWGALGLLMEGERDPDPRFAPGRRKERGFIPIRIDRDCSLFEGLSDQPSFFQSHYWQLEEVPDGFVARAHSDWSPIQAIERLDRPVFGVQFHPERSDREHADGDELLRNFFCLATS